MIFQKWAPQGEVRSSYKESIPSCPCLLEVKSFLDCAKPPQAQETVAGASETETNEPFFLVIPWLLHHRTEI